MTIDAPLLEPGTRSRVVGSYDALALRDGGTFDDLAAFAAELCARRRSRWSAWSRTTVSPFWAGSAPTWLETPRSLSFCAHAMNAGAIMEVPDTLLDPRFADNALVTDDPRVRFYAGAPLVNRDGVPLGAVCVLDTATADRVDPVPAARAGGAGGRHDGAAGTAPDPARRRTERTAGSAPWQIPCRRWCGRRCPMASTIITMRAGMNSPARLRDRPMARAGTACSMRTIRSVPGHCGGIRWRRVIRTRSNIGCVISMAPIDGCWAARCPSAARTATITRWFGTCTDIHAQKLASEEREVISQELSHRIKNIFAVIAGLVGFAARARPEFAPAAVDLRQRITALGRAHDFVRPHSAQSRPAGRQDSLKNLLAELFEPYQQGRDAADRRAGRRYPRRRPVRHADGAAVPRTGDQRVQIRRAVHGWTGKVVAKRSPSTEDEVTMDWRETGVVRRSSLHPPTSKGFGSQLVEMSAVRQLGGRVTRVRGMRTACR